MRKITLFMNVTLDGYFEGPGHDLSWAHSDFEPFSPEESDRVDTILLGHRTYDMMKSFWPTPEAEQVAPQVARFMNERRKVVAAHQPFEPGWNNVTVVSGDVPDAIRRLKAAPGRNLIMLGSNALCVSLMKEGLVDEFQLVVNPVAIGGGTPLFQGLDGRAELELIDTRRFASGSVLLSYAPRRPAR